MPLHAVQPGTSPSVSFADSSPARVRAYKEWIRMGPALSPSPWDKAGSFYAHFNPYILGSHACGTAQLRRVLRTKQPKRSRGSGLLFASGLRPAQQKQGTATKAGAAVRPRLRGPPRQHGPQKQCGGQPSGRPPQRDPIFRDAKFFCFGAINNRRNSGYLSLFAVTSDGLCLSGGL